MILIHSIFPSPFTEVFLNNGKIDLLGQIVLCGVCPVNYRMFGSIPDLHSVDASSTLPPQYDNTKMSPDTV